MAQMVSKPNKLFVAFLYRLVRDHLPFGVIEGLVNSVESSRDQELWLSEEHQAAWAESIMMRLCDDPEGDT